MFNLKDLDTSHITSLHLTSVEKGAIYIHHLENLNHTGTASAPITTDTEMPSSQAAPDSERLLCVTLNLSCRTLLCSAEKNGLITYNPQRQGYDPSSSTSQAQVAYLCGRIFCGDYSSEGLWKEGRRFNAAQFCQQIFGFDVAATRRKLRAKGEGKLPKGYEKIDKIFNK